MTHKKPITKIIAGVLSVVMVFGVLMFVSPTEAQAISLNATDTGFYNLAYGANGATTFGAGSQIRVINKTRADKGKSKSDTIYGYDGITWSAVDTNNYIVWDGTGENTFYGVYPYNAEYNSFTIPTDQSGGVQDADWMTANYTAAKDEGNVNLNFHHCLAKVTVNITKWNSEFDGSEKVIEDPKIYTKGTDITVSYDTYEYTSDGSLTPITPSADGHTYTAIVAPAEYAITDKFMTFTVDGQEMTVLATTPKQTNGLNAGLHYTFNLTVGKNGVAIQSVEVTDWTDRIINDVESEEVEITTIIEGSTATITVPDIATDAMVQNAMNELTTDGLSTIIVEGSLNETRQGYIATALAGKTVTLYLTHLAEDELIDELASTDDGITVNCGYYMADASTYVAYNADGLQAWSTYAQANPATNLSLGKDITLPLAEGENSNWTSVGSDITPYTGTVNGNGHSITGMTINQTTNNAGFIGYLGENGAVKNLKLKDVSVTTTGNYVGGLVGYSCSVIENCAVEGGKVSSTGEACIGGIVGRAEGKSSAPALIVACHNTAAVSGKRNVGGIIGSAWDHSRVIACYNSGSITHTDGWRCGGIVGIFGFNGMYLNCNYNTGNTTEEAAIAGDSQVTKYHNYWSSDHDYAFATNFEGDYKNYTAIKITSASEWQTAMTTMNTWLAENGYAYRYALNTDAATKDAQPLVIVKAD